MRTLFPAPKAVIEAKGIDWTKPENIMGNGAYIAHRKHPGERVVAKRNPNYWDNEQHRYRRSSVADHQ